MNMIKRYAGIFALAMAGSITGSGIYNHYFVTREISAARSSVTPVRTVSYTGVAPAFDFTQAAEATVPAVVHVTTSYQPSAQQQNIDPFGFFFGPQAPRAIQPQQASGSGVIISNDGYIVTNNHVVQDAKDVDITLDDKRSYKAKVIGTDPSTDLALLKIDGKNLPYLSYGNSDNVRVGEWVMAVGNPFNLNSTVTAGIVSAKGRNIHIMSDQKFPIESFIQTDAAVNPGNSGGALVNTNGDLIGINAAIASNTGSYTGYSFAIPVNIVRKVVDDLLQYGNVQRGFIGVSIRDIDSEFAKEKSISTLNGVYINGLTDGGAASEAGLKEGDVITSINGLPVRTTPELQEIVGRYRPGDKLDVKVLRNENEKSFAITLRNKEGNTKVMRDEVVNILGASLENVNDKDQNRLGIKNGIQIKDLQSGKLKNAGIKEGFIITSIDNKEVNSTEDVVTYLKEKKGGVLIEGVYPNGMHAYYGFGM